jgi:hypothetical protein
MLCYAMLCYAMLCYAMLCYAMLCYAMQGRIQRLNLTVAFWMKSTCGAEGHALPRGVWGHAPPENFWNLEPARTISCILSIEIRFKICRKVPVFHTKIRKKRTKVTKYIHQHTTSNNRLSWKSKITVVRKFSNVHHLETAAQRQLGKMFIWWSSSMYIDHPETAGQLMAVRKNIFCTVYMFICRSSWNRAQRQLGKMFICICLFVLKFEQYCRNSRKAGCANFSTAGNIIRAKSFAV